MLCQFMSNASTIGGDSGGPVTSYPSVTCSQGGCIQNLGIHWGKEYDANGTLRQVFSPFYFVSAELANAMGGGSLSAHACATAGCYPY
jgi:hypothetical protein